MSISDGECPTRIPFGERISDLARMDSDGVAITYEPANGPVEVLTWGELDARSNAVARLLESAGVDSRSRVAVMLTNCPMHYVVTIATWKLGAMVLPVKASLPPRERDQLLRLLEPAVVVSHDTASGAGFRQVTDLELANAADRFPRDPMPTRVAHPGKAIASGGSTGRPKIIVDPRPWMFQVGSSMGGGVVTLVDGDTQLVAGALFHNSPFTWSFMGLFEHQHIVLMDRFDAKRAVELIDRHQVNFLFLAPTMMQRIVRLPDLQAHKVSSIRTLFHTAAPCPPWLKRAWIDLIGADRVVERFGATEAVGNTVITGTEWLDRPGSVGLGELTDIRILDKEGRQLPAGAIGEIYMKRHSESKPTYEYLGSEPARMVDGYTSVGDLGHLDSDGYLYLADRRADMINSGGVNIYPAEIEGVLTEYSGVRDAAVVGVPDDDLGQCVHAIVELDPAAPREQLDTAAILAHCRAQLSSEKIPRSIEFVEQLPRDEAGKLRRSSLIANR